MCAYEFPVGPERIKNCSDCGAINPLTAKDCHACGKAFGQGFELSLNEALRDGAITRGMDIDETEVQMAEEIAPELRQRILRSGDQNLVLLLQRLPDETHARLAEMVRDVYQ